MLKIPWPGNLSPLLFWGFFPHRLLGLASLVLCYCRNEKVKPDEPTRTAARHHPAAGR
jgi:hypothetical protein